MKKIITSIIILSFIFSGIVSAGEFQKGRCPSDLIMTQNMKAPRVGESYIRNGRYHWYTKTTVREAHILQKHLNRLGFNAGKVDGIIGPKTKGAILRLQAFLGTKQDGYVGPETRKLLNESCGGKMVYSDENQKYTGNLKLIQGEKSLRDFVEKVENYQEVHFGDDIISSRGDNLLENMQLANLDTSNLPNLEVISFKKGTSSDFSETNTQVDGVDEADITKTDGKYIYTISKSKKLFIFDASNPKNMKTVAKITAEKNESMREMYLFKNKLILISNYWENSDTDFSIQKRIAIYPYPRNKSFTRIEVYDIENPRKPIKVKKVDFEGRLRESRITNGYLYFVTSKNIYKDYSILPMVKIDGVEKTKIFGESFYYIDSPLKNHNLTSITALNLENLSKMSSKRILMPNVGNIYMSKNNFYLTYNKYFDTRKIYGKLNEDISDLMSEREGELDNENIKILDNGKVDYVSEEIEIDNIEISLDENFKPTIVGSSTRKFTKKEKDENFKYLVEKKKKIDEKFKGKIEKTIKNFYENNKDNFEKTKIEKFSLDGIKISPKSSGEVSGFSLNQFSMHEDKDENFFIATTKNQNWLPWHLRSILGGNIILNESENNLFSLDKNLKNIDSIEGLAKGERIKSVRFVKDHAYLVTFKQTDPLFNIDISNPKKLKLLGELKIDGFSQYLHPVFNDRLIGLGRSITTDKYGNLINSGLKVTLFDISKDNPKEIKSLYLGDGGYSEALNNHKAILVSEDKNIMAFPATYFEGLDFNKRKYNTGVVLLNIERNDISKISLLETGTGWEQKAKRVIRIGDVVHAVAIEKSRSFNIKDGEEMGKIFFENEKEITTY